MKILEHQKFRRALLELRRRGGSFQRAADSVYSLLGRLQSDPSALESMKTTNHGETRITKAVKYDLAGACRLITIQDAGYVFLCFAGDHGDCDRWLDSNRGLKVKVAADGKPLVVFGSIDVQQPAMRIERASGMISRPLLDLLPDRLRSGLLDGLPAAIVRLALNLSGHSSEDEILETVELIHDQTRSTALFDVMVLLRSEDVEGARRRIRVYLGELVEVAEAARRDTACGGLVDSEDFQRVTLDPEHYRALIERYASTGDYRDWMLFMPPDQQRLVDADFAGPAKLSGVSGSGKTCVLINRAVALANKYPEQRILVLTINKPLAALIAALTSKAAPVDIASRIQVEPLFRLCQGFLREFEPGTEKLYDDVTWKSREHIDEIWREFYRCELNNHSAKVLQRLHDSLITRGIDAETYLREEFDWVRSAVFPDRRSDYLTIERKGRSYPLDQDFRKLVLDGLSAWEGKMRAIGVTDYLGIATAAARYVERIEPAYRCVLVDESQDFGTLELALVRRLVSPAENDVFLCGDAAQQVSTKHQELSVAGIGVPGARSTKLMLNYRNSRDVLEVAHEVLVDNLAEEMIHAKDFDVLDPQYANFSGPMPLLLSANDIGDQVFFAVRYAMQEVGADPSRKIVIAVCGRSGLELATLASLLDLPQLDDQVDVDAASVFLSDLESTKGFEFHTVIVLDCSDGAIPNPLSPEQERYRDLSRLYVAMTRAQCQLIIGFSGEPSPFLKQRRHRFLEATWVEYLSDEVPEGGVPPQFTPPKLEQIRPNDLVDLPIGEMAGSQFLYTEHAIGLPANVVERIRTTVTGRSRVVSRAPVEWKSMGLLIKDLELPGQAGLKARNNFGTESARAVMGLFANMRARGLRLARIEEEA